MISRGYKKTEVGVIPNDWECKNLGDSEPLVTSGSRGWAKYYSEAGDAFIRITNLNRSSIYPDLNDLRFVSLPENAAEGSRTRLVIGDVLVSITADIGIIGYVNHNFPETAYINQHIALIRFGDISCAKYISYSLASAEPQSRFSAATDSGAKAGINLDTLRQIKIPLPPTKAEQEAIAEALSDADALIESLEQLIAKKRLIKQGAMQELLTGKKRLPGFEGEWEEKSFRDIFDFLSTATNSRSELSNTGELFYIHYGDIHTKFHGHLNFEKSSPPKVSKNIVGSASRISNGDWIMADASEDLEGVGKLVEVVGMQPDQAGVAGLHTFLLREKKTTFAPMFKGHLGDLEKLHHSFLHVATGMKVFGVSKKALALIMLPVPPLEEQTAIANILTDMDDAITALEAKLAKARQIKQGMMQELLTGKTRLV